MLPATRPGSVPGLVLDGMPSELVHFQGGRVVLKVEGNAGRQGDFSGFIGYAIETAWQLVASPYCRNALADTAAYVGKSLPRETEPPRKAPIETMVLGPEEDRLQLLEALRRQHRDS